MAVGGDRRGRAGRQAGTYAAAAKVVQQRTAGGEHVESDVAAAKAVRPVGQAAHVKQNAVAIDLDHPVCTGTRAEPVAGREGNRNVRPNGLPARPRRVNPQLDHLRGWAV